MTGNERLLAVWEQRDELERQYVEWRTQAELIISRRPRWERLHRLLSHAQSLPVAAKVQPAIDAIGEQRLLLQEPDPLPALIAEVAAALRQAVHDAQEQLRVAFDDATRDLHASEPWLRLDEEQRAEILDKYQLRPAAEVEVGTDEALVQVLDATPLHLWADRVAAIGARARDAVLAAAQALEPQVRSVTLPSRTLHSADDVASYVEEVKDVLLEHVKRGPVVIS